MFRLMLPAAVVSKFFLPPLIWPEAANASPVDADAIERGEGQSRHL